MTMKERCLRAMEYHEKGLNCGQSVLLAFADITGFSEEQSMALASGFGGGLRCGGVCGVVNAAAVVLGMVYPATLENGAAGKKRLGADKGVPAALHGAVPQAGLPRPAGGEGPGCHGHGPGAGRDPALPRAGGVRRGVAV